MPIHSLISGSNVFKSKSVHLECTALYNGSPWCITYSVPDICSFTFMYKAAISSGLYILSTKPSLPIFNNTTTSQHTNTNDNTRCDIPSTWRALCRTGVAHVLHLSKTISPTLRRRVHLQHQPHLESLRRTLMAYSATVAIQISPSHVMDASGVYTRLSFARDATSSQQLSMAASRYTDLLPNIALAHREWN